MLRGECCMAVVPYSSYMAKATRARLPRDGIGKECNRWISPSTP
jgi:hypothetical protein